MVASRFGRGAAAVVALVAVGAQSAHAADDPSARARESASRLAGDIRTLVPAGEAQAALLGPLKRTLAQIATDPCAGVESTTALRRQLDDASANLDPAARATLRADGLGLLAELLQRPDTRSCGGGAPAGAAGGPVVRVLKQSPAGVQLRVTLPRASFVGVTGDGLDFTGVGMDGMGASGKLGAPSIPSLTQMLGIPDGAEVAVQPTGSVGYTLPDVLIAPRQDEAADTKGGDDPFANPPFAFDRQAYEQGVFPERVAAGQPLGHLRDITVGGVELDGAQYDAAKRSLHVLTGFNVTVRFRGGKGFGPKSAISPWNRSYAAIYANSLANWATVKANLVNARFRFCGEELLVITSPALRGAADTLATHRRSAGFLTRVVEVGSGAGQIGTTPAEIQTYIRSRLNSNCLIRPSYVAIVGDVDQVPTWLITTPWAPTDFDGMIATDNPYGLADGSDLIPDLAVGRIPARTLTEANDAVAKIVDYEDHAPTLAADFYRHATITSFFQADSGTVASPQTTDSRTFTRASETIAGALEASGKTVDRVYTADTSIAHPKKYDNGVSMPSGIQWPGFAWNGTGADVISDWQAGRFLILHRDHGDPSGWGNPDVDTSDVPSLTNGKLLPVVFSINCASGKMDDATQSFVEQIVLKKSGGAVGAIGDTRNSPSNTNSHIALGMLDAIFPNVLPSYGSSSRIVRMGDVLVAGKQYMDTQNGLDGQTSSTTQAEHSLYHWFGDPTMSIRISRPFPWWAYVKLDRAVLRLDRYVKIKPLKNLPRGGWVTVFQGSRAIGRAPLTRTGATVPFDAKVLAGKPIRVAFESLDGTGRSVAIRG